MCKFPRVISNAEPAQVLKWRIVWIGYESKWPEFVTITGPRCHIISQQLDSRMSDSEENMLHQVLAQLVG